MSFFLGSKKRDHSEMVKTVKKHRENSSLSDAIFSDDFN